jgi:hypothetical protein
MLKACLCFVGGADVFAENQGHQTGITEIKTKNPLTGIITVNLPKGDLIHTGETVTHMGETLCMTMTVKV